MDCNIDHLENVVMSLAEQLYSRGLRLKSGMAAVLQSSIPGMLVLKIFKDLKLMFSKESAKQYQYNKYFTADKGKGNAGHRFVNVYAG